ncbi:MAG: hypothetical protein VW831_07480, partial [Gammaproteobacteria bacterium]
LNCIAMFFFLIAFSLTIVNAFVCLPQQAFLLFILGEIIIVLFLKDIKESSCFFHIYQILLFYFYYTLVVTPIYNPLNDQEKYYEQRHGRSLARPDRTHNAFCDASLEVARWFPVSAGVG